LIYNRSVLIERILRDSIKIEAKKTVHELADGTKQYDDSLRSQKARRELSEFLFRNIFNCPVPDQDTK